MSVQSIASKSRLVPINRQLMLKLLTVEAVKPVVEAVGVVGVVDAKSVVEVVGCC